MEQWLLAFFFFGGGGGMPDRIFKLLKGADDHQTDNTENEYRTMNLNPPLLIAVWLAWRPSALH